MIEYPHIDSIFKRDERGRFLFGQYSQPEFEYLRNLTWVGTEKVDGTNIRVIYDGALNGIRFGGKTDKAQTPPFLLERLQNIFYTTTMSERLPAQFPEGATLYGEGYGARIQKGGGNYNPLGVDFILFDVRVGNWWLTRSAVCEVAQALDLHVVPAVYYGGLDVAINFVRDGFPSIVASWRGEPSTHAEGLVLQPAVPLRRRNGDRVITKIKEVDFRG